MCPYREENRPRRARRLSVNPQTGKADPMQNALTLAPVRPVAVRVPQAAQLLGLSTRDVRTLIEDGMLRTVGLGPRRVVPVVELERYVAENAAK